MIQFFLLIFKCLFLDFPNINLNLNYTHYFNFHSLYHSKLKTKNNWKSLYVNEYVFCIQIGILLIKKVLNANYR